MTDPVVPKQVQIIAPPSPCLIAGMVLIRCIWYCALWLTKWGFFHLWLQLYLIQVDCNTAVKQQEVHILQYSSNLNFVKQQCFQCKSFSDFQLNYCVPCLPLTLNKITPKAYCLFSFKKFMKLSGSKLGEWSCIKLWIEILQSELNSTLGNLLFIVEVTEVLACKPQHRQYFGATSGNCVMELVGKFQSKQEKNSAAGWLK